MHLTNCIYFKSTDGHYIPMYRFTLKLHHNCVAHVENVDRELLCSLLGRNYKILWLNYIRTTKLNKNDFIPNFPVSF